MRYFMRTKIQKEKFIATQTKYAKSLVAAIMTNILFTQEHATVVSRATRKMFDKIFAQKRFKKTGNLTDAPGGDQAGTGECKR